MSQQSPSRRRFLSGAARAAAGAALPLPVLAQASPMPVSTGSDAGVVPFRGTHQGGIATPMQSHTYFAAFDLVAAGRDEVVELLKAWTLAAERMAAGRTAQPMDGGLKLAVPTSAALSSAAALTYAASDVQATVADSGEAIGLSPARLTVTFGFGPGLFVDAAGRDRYGLGARRPEALVDMPRFPGEQLVPAQTGGDVSVQACANDPQVAFHAVRQLARIADGVARIRWVQAGFQPAAPAGKTGRNLMGFLDGTINPDTGDPKAMNRFVWAGEESPAWMQGGSYQVTRRIRIALEHWDRMNLAFQERTIGRHKLSGAPLGGHHEREHVDLEARGPDGNPLIPPNSHVGVAAALRQEGVEILRRGYAYNDGVNLTAERWPPWHEGMEFDAGLLFVAYQRDPRQGFIRIFERMSRFDMMNQFVTPVGGGLFACPRGALPGEYLGQDLFEA